MTSSGNPRNSLQRPIRSIHWVTQWKCRISINSIQPIRKPHFILYPGLAGTENILSVFNSDTSFEAFCNNRRIETQNFAHAQRGGGECYKVCWYIKRVYLCTVKPPSKTCLEVQGPNSRCKGFQILILPFFFLYCMQSPSELKSEKWNVKNFTTRKWFVKLPLTPVSGRQSQIHQRVNCTPTPSLWVVGTNDPKQAVRWPPNTPDSLLDTHKVRESSNPSRYSSGTRGALGARAPPGPQDFFKIMQFSSNFKGKPLFWANFGLRLHWAPPPTKILDPRLWLSKFHTISRVR